jgi:hypothetical protein
MVDGWRISNEEFEQLIAGEEELRAELGDEVEDLGTTKGLLNLLNGRWLGGSRLALAQCVIACHERRARLPDWALEELAKGFRRYLEWEPLDQALFGVAKAGRHADPRTEAEEEWPKVCAGFAYLEALDEFKARKTRLGARVFERAAELCAERFDVRLTPSTIERYWKRYRRLILSAVGMVMLGIDDLVLRKGRRSRVRGTKPP